MIYHLELLTRGRGTKVFVYFSVVVVFFTNTAHFSSSARDHFWKAILITLRPEEQTVSVLEVFVVHLVPLGTVQLHVWPDNSHIPAELHLPSPLSPPVNKQAATVC